MKNFAKKMCAFFIAGTVLTCFFSTSVWADQLKSEADEDAIVITVETDEEALQVLEELKQNNERVKRLWEQNLSERGNRDPKFLTSLIMPKSLETTSVLTHTMNWLTGHKVHFYATYNSYYDNYGNKRISSVNNFYAFIPLTGSVNNFEYQTALLDARRTIAVNTSMHVIITSMAGLSYHYVLGLYMEFYLNGGGKIY